MVNLIQAYEKNLIKVKNASANTVSSYLRDIRQYSEWLQRFEGLQIVDATASIRQQRKTPSMNLVYTYGGSVHKLVVPATAVV